MARGKGVLSPPPKRFNYSSADSCSTVILHNCSAIKLLEAFGSMQVLRCVHAVLGLGEGRIGLE
jgi:hypothetical protein